MSQSDALDYFKENSGYARMKDLKSRGIHPRVLRSFLRKGLVAKIKPGVYKLNNYHSSEHQSLIDLCQAVPRGVVCLHSALHYYGLLSAGPVRNMIALPQGYHVPKVHLGDFQSFYFSRALYDTEIETLHLEGGVLRIYSREKALADAFRFRKRLGASIAEEALRNYVRSTHRHMGRLLVLAREYRVLQHMLPLLSEVM